jgi:hypothetical protein
MGFLQLGQWDPGQMIDSSFGSRKIQTFKKLPTIAPIMIEIMLSIVIRLRLRLGSRSGQRLKVRGLGQKGLKYHQPHSL